MFERLKSEIKDLGGEEYFADIPDEFLTERKLANLSASLKEEYSGLTRVQTYPFRYIIEPTNLCNLACTLCPTGQDDNRIPKGQMTLDFFRKVIDRIHPYCGVLYLQNWGEATLLKGCPAMIRYAADRGIWVVLSTNFSIPYRPGYVEELISSGLGLLHVDVDGTTQETYVHYRRSGDLDLVLSNSREAIRIKREKGLTYPVIEATMLVMQHNEHQVEEFHALCRNVGFDQYSLGKLQVNPNRTKDWLPKNAELRYENYFTPDTEKPSCGRLYTTMVVGWFGTLSACCIVYDPRADFGMLADGDLLDAWNNESYISARASFHDPKAVSCHTICADCKNDLGGTHINRYKNSFAITR